MHKPLFVTGIGTDIGKTLISAILVEKLKCDYWKPVQAGELDNSDTMKVQRLISNDQSVFHPEAYRLTQPYSPHKSAALDGVTIEEQTIIAPKTGIQLLIEGAGGLMVPLNDHCLVIDLVKQLGAEVILVSQNYLGSINHTLLSIEALKQRCIPLKGIIFNGDENTSTEDYITTYTQVAHLGRIPKLDAVNKETIANAGRYISL
ncbi:MULTISPECIES: dethiobiotin synthase [unclassified Mucilaginibacter]|uniref:dethiobiotin synthase n=1 Tax=unclassified Mucilaginibacter TaxID=2617802 RepID=UPI002AC8CF47|nr:MULTISPECIES: dethiobiotin synthase [unclassified Mucilaginibacter]MEB0248845.1 dethiobiotin synthase [Mucilaginibacter sp. 5B2]MEB0261241.1 dethiobiotin synthase [Mucilaginibacter sp. 10I4]MEB0279065.1 dethiobiotin synthase [Mucilaginibacter sp. 10B2]MEB0299916.1 dethiobiotin synthase [Mucilaginibacter sp. 5C4]WPX22243.1 dethiobiotin synthase [Mucilaginibacter sp. 5C4]